MNRVWKRFLFKVSIVVGGIAYVVVSMLLGGFIANWLGYSVESGTIAGAFVMVIFPMIAFMLRDTYLDSKREVERENKEMMRALKGNKYDF